MRFIIIAVIAYLLYRVCRNFFTTNKKITRNEHGGMIDEMVQDPVCKTYVPMREAVRKVSGGREVFFCSKECSERFEEETKR
jgi:uncharacterized protein